MRTAHAKTANPAFDPDSSPEDQVERHLGLVHHVARKLSRSLSVDVDFDDLVSAGTMGLMRALVRFAPDRGHSLSTFAAPRIRGAILDELRRQDHVPRSTRRKARELATAEEALTQGLGRQPRAEEVAQKLGLTVQVVERWRLDISRSSHLQLYHQSDVDGPSSVVEALLPDPEVADPLDELVQKEKEQRVRSALLELTDTEQTVLQLYYWQDLSLREIGVRFGLTEARISQIKRDAVDRLRKLLGTIDDAVFA